MVNQDKVNSIVNMVRNLITAREMTEVLTNEAINALIDEVVNLGIPCTDEDLEACRRDLKYRYAIESTPGSIILNDYKNCKTERREYQVGKERCVIVRHFCGDKDLSEVLYRNAFERAFSEVMAMNRTPQTT